MTSFRVKGKIFATVPPTEERVHIFIADETVEEAVAVGRGSVEELWWGKRRQGVRVALKGADPDLVVELLRDAWERKAPKGRKASPRP